MGSHHHRSGPLKQKNKQHKTGKHDSKSFRSRQSGGKVEQGGSGDRHANAASNKTVRLQRQKQLREQKREDLYLQRRYGSGSTLGPPKVIALVGLSELANLSEVKESIFEGVSTLEEPVADGLMNCTTGVFSQHKQKVCVVECGNDLLTAMDACKVADIVAFVLPMHQGMDVCLNETGERILTSIKAQGLPSTVGVIQGLEMHNQKHQTELRKNGQRFFQTEFGEHVKVTQGNTNSQLTRAIMTMSPRTIHWREERPYMLATGAKFTSTDDDIGTLEVSGYIRGKPLSANQLVHITDVGTFQLAHIAQGKLKQSTQGTDQDMAGSEETQDAVVLASADPEVQEDLQYEAEYNPFAGEQTWPTEEEINEANESTMQEQKNMSSYQAAWMDENDEEDDTPLVDQGFLQSTEKEEDGDDISMDDEDEANYMKQMAQIKSKREQESENQTFPDEVDVPEDTPARERFARYRGMKSLRTSMWDPKESLPSDYARLFQFEDFAMVQRMALQRGRKAQKAMRDELKRQHQRSRASSMASGMDVDSETSFAPDFGSDGYVPSGVFVTLHVKDVSYAAYQKRVQSGPLILGALHKHENRLSVLNFSVQRAGSFDEPLKSKEPLEFHCGFRRFEGKPVYSDQSLKSDQHLFQRFLPQSGWAVASVYGPVTFQPASVLMFKDDRKELVAHGTLHDVNPDRVVLKRVILTGTPVKVKKRKAVVRYMFHSPEDIRWFKPVELTTKHGMSGHIKESLGTHGDFKALFNKPVKQHDTICLALYKRVYPKFLE